eukprot:146750-Amphidinium_carterae.1
MGPRTVGACSGQKLEKVEVGMKFHALTCSLEIKKSSWLFTLSCMSSGSKKNNCNVILFDQEQLLPLGPDSKRADLGFERQLTAHHSQPRPACSASP